MRDFTFDFPFSTTGERSTVGDLASFIPRENGLKCSESM
jgi:hypothetical protein